MGDMRKRELKKQATVHSREHEPQHDSLTWGPGFYVNALSEDDVVAQLRWRSRRRCLPTAARSRIACLIIRCAHMLAVDAAWASSACVESSVVPAARSSSGGETVPRSRVGAKDG